MIFAGRFTGSRNRSERRPEMLEAGRQPPGGPGFGEPGYACAGIPVDRFGVILRKVWGGSCTWAGARAKSVLMSVWRTCWQQPRSALDFLRQLLRGRPVALALPP
jgi:hypothetical protein